MTPVVHGRRGPYGAKQQLAHSAWRAILAVGIDHTYVVAWAQAPKRANGPLTDGFIDETSLNGPIPFENAYLKALLKGGPDGGKSMVPISRKMESGRNPSSGLGSS